MDNLIDTMDTGEILSGISQDTKKKCSSIKNLSCIAPKSREDQKEVKITSVWIDFRSLVLEEISYFHIIED